MSENGNSKTVINCPHCKQRFSVTMPPAVIFNDLRVSMLVVTHEKPIKCICGKLSVVALASAQMSWSIVGLTDEQAGQFEEGRIVAAPSWKKEWGTEF